MTRNEFFFALQANGIDLDMFSFDDSVKEGYCVRKNGFRWETLVKERGKERDVLGFPSEEDALENLLGRILTLYSNRSSWYLESE